MLDEVILIDTNVIKKDNNIYYVAYCYIPELKAFNTVFINLDTFNYLNELPSYEDISNMTSFTYDRKSSTFKLKITVKKI